MLNVRWDFIGLSTEAKPTTATGKVVDGSTFYEVDTSTLYIYYGGNWIKQEYEGGKEGQTIQYEEMPEASSSFENKVIQYIGDTTNDYTKGYFYTCIGAGDPKVYSWLEISVQESSQEVYFVDVNNSSNPFIFEGKKRGLYILRTQSNTFYYKGKESSNIKNISNTGVVEIEIYEDIDSITSTISNAGKIKYFVYNSTFGSYTDLKTSIIEISYTNDTYISINLLATTTFGQFVNSGRQNFDGMKVFSTIPRQSNSTAPTNDNEFTNKKYVDDAVAGAGGGGSAVFIVDFDTATTPAQKIAAFNEWYQYYKTGNDDWQLIWKSGSIVFTNPMVYEDTYSNKVYITFKTEIGEQSKYNGSSSENVNCYSLAYFILNISSGNVSGFADYGTRMKIAEYQNYIGTPKLNAPLGTSNNYAYTPTNDYNPATKKYVDDAIAQAIANLGN